MVKLIGKTDPGGPGRWKWWRYLAGNMHGDETVGRQLLLYLAHYLLHQYDKLGDSPDWSKTTETGYFRSEKVKFLVDSMELYLVPTMNPDGFAMVEFDEANVNECRYKYEFHHL